MENKTVWVCDTCGSDAVYFDAYVNVNDIQDIRVFDYTMCDVCGGETTIREINVEEMDTCK
jgi:rRNA maturation endonuclease Nob1